MNLSDLYGSIHGRPEYVHFQYRFNVVSLFLLISYCYVLVTVMVVLRMWREFKKPQALVTSSYVQKNVFLAFIWMQAANLLFYVFDNLVFRIPPSGLMTSWLASTSPAVFLKLTYYFLLISNYLSTFFSLLFCLVRLFVVYFPGSYLQKVNILFTFYIPTSFVLPFLLTLFFLPATVYCKQIGEPYRLGALYFSYVGAWLNLYSDPFNVFVNFLSTVVIVVINLALMKKIRVMMQKKTRSSRSLKSEISLTLMTLTMNIPFFANGAITIIGSIDLTKSPYALLPRQIASDVGLVAVPWLFFLTHPMFLSKTSRMWTISGGSSGTPPLRNFLKVR